MPSQSSQESPTHFKSAQVRQSFRRRLRHWFRNHSRDLPWRRTRDPYAIWVSEIMLQQTQVATVIDYFNRFLAQFPTIEDLAAADEARVLKLWEGLGYYRRARQLHRAAQVIQNEHDGRFPTTFAEVIKLPGVGRYTAGAILSIALDQPHPILEGNTVRVYSRLDGFANETKDRQGQDHLWSFAENLVTRHQPGELNQALMELGSEICTPRDPTCNRCPVRVHCAAFSTGDPTAFPVSERRMKYEDRKESVVVVQHDDRVLLRECGPSERWAGLWDFPRFELPIDTSDKELAGAVSNCLREATGLDVQLPKPFWKTKHAVTRFRIQLSCFRCEINERPESLQRAREYRWIEVNQLGELPMSVTGRMIAERIQTNEDYESVSHPTHPL